MKPVTLPDSYPQLLQRLKTEIATSRTRAALKVNEELIELYWRIGKEIYQRRHLEGWGAGVVERLASDLRREFPEMKGLSERSLRYMQAFYGSYKEQQKLPQVVAQIPWGHNRILLDKLDDSATRKWYAAKAVENGWSRNVLALQIDTKLHERQPSELTNFKSTIPAPQSDLARELVKDPYNFEFLAIQDKAAERELHEGLVTHIQSFLLELGAGFSFVGSQYHLEIDDRDFYIDLLFYHLKLRCYVVIELKSGEFQPEYAGKMNFYLSALDDLVRDPEHDQPTIGLLLCREKSRIIAEYALRDTNKPMGVSSYLTETLPEQLEKTLPSIDQLQRELTDDTTDQTTKDSQ